MSKLPLDLLHHIHEELDFLIAESKKMTEGQFQGDEKSKRAFVRSLEIIGEYSRKIDNRPPDLPVAHLA